MLTRLVGDRSEMDQVSDRRSHNRLIGECCEAVSTDRLMKRREIKCSRPSKRYVGGQYRDNSFDYYAYVNGVKFMIEQKTWRKTWLMNSDQLEDQIDKFRGYRGRKILLMIGARPLRLRQVKELEYYGIEVVRLSNIGYECLDQLAEYLIGLADHVCNNNNTFARVGLNVSEGKRSSYMRKSAEDRQVERDKASEKQNFKTYVSGYSKTVNSSPCCVAYNEGVGIG